MADQTPLFTHAAAMPGDFEIVEHIPPLLIVGAIIVGVIIGAVIIAVFTETDHA